MDASTAVPNTIRANNGILKPCAQLLALAALKHMSLPVASFSASDYVFRERTRMVSRELSQLLLNPL